MKMKDRKYIVPPSRLADRQDCYGDKTISGKNRCSRDNCKWFIPCRILCDYKIEMFEYSLVNQLIDILPRPEIVEILMKNYSISYKAAKMATKRWMYIIRNRTCTRHVCVDTI